MAASHTVNGKAFEYACLQSLYNALKDSQEVVVEQSNALQTTMQMYKAIGSRAQTQMNLGADAATRVILKLEPQLITPLSNTPLYLSIQNDSQGICGDVRDIVCLRKQNEWEIGLSCKNNHKAVKHNRLSAKNDFGDSWLGIPCSPEYFKQIAPLFDQLKKFKTERVLWSSIIDKEDKFYVPILEAFMQELIRMDQNQNGHVPEKLIKYLLGKHDFYKVIKNDRERSTQVMAFNINGTLSKSAGSVRSLINIPRLPMPSRFHYVDFKPSSKTTIQIVLDKGWTISMRIHNGESVVAPSLKFDVQLEGVPESLHNQFEAWD